MIISNNKDYFKYYFIISKNDLNLGEELPCEKVHFLDGRAFHVTDNKKEKYFYINTDENNLMKKVYSVFIRKDKTCFIHHKKGKLEISIDSFNSKMNHNNQFADAHLDLIKNFVAGGVKLTHMAL